MLAAPAGLYTDALAYWLRKLSVEVRVTRCGIDPGHLTADASNVELALLDLDTVPIANRLSTVRAFRAHLPQALIVAIATPTNDRHVEKLGEAGVDAYLPKNASETEALSILQGLLNRTGRPGTFYPSSTQSKECGPNTDTPGRAPRSRHMHPYGLTAREMEILKLVCDGLTNLEISRRCGISEGVVKLHLHNAYGKLGVQGRVQAIRVVEHLDGIRQLQIRGIEQGAPLLDWLLPHMSDQLHKKGDVLFRKGEPGSTLYYIQAGTVRLPEIEVEMIAGDLFGEIGIFAPGHVRTCTAICESDTRLFQLNAEQAKRLCFENPQFAYYLIRLIAERLTDERSQSG